MPICKTCCLPLNLTSGWPDVYRCYTFLALEAERQKMDKKSNRNQRVSAVLLEALPSRQTLWYLTAHCAELWCYMSKFSTNLASGFSGESRLSFLSRGQSRPLADTLVELGFPLLSCLIMYEQKGKALQVILPIVASHHKSQNNGLISQRVR